MRILLLARDTERHEVIKVKMGNDLYVLCVDSFGVKSRCVEAKLVPIRLTIAMETLTW